MLSSTLTHLQINMELDGFQIDAISRLKNGNCLCGGVGSGKSRTALAYYYFVVCGGGSPLDNGWMTTPRDLYIITTAKKRDTGEWTAELACLPHMEKVNIVVDSWNNIRKYCNVCSAFFIFDEQRLVGSGAWVKAFYQIAKKNQWILLTATPGDSWMDYIALFVANGFFRNRTEFITKHVVYDRFAKYPKVKSYIDVDTLVRLKNRILVYMDYTKRTQDNHIKVVCGYDIGLYNGTASRRWNPMTQEPISTPGELCLVLRQIVNSSLLRIQEFEKWVQKVPKLIVFYNFDYELTMLRESLKNSNTPFAEWNGHKHMPVPSTNRWVYLVQYAAGAEGWNCIETDTILFYSYSYSYKQTIQAAGRIDRRNTKFQYLYYIHFASSSSIDRAIEKCLKDKRDFNEKELFPM